MVGWHHQLDGYEFKQTLGDREGQRHLMCCSPWGRKERDTCSDWTTGQKSQAPLDSLTRDGKRVIISINVVCILWCSVNVLQILIDGSSDKHTEMWSKQWEPVLITNLRDNGTMTFAIYGWLFFPGTHSGDEVIFVYMHYEDNPFPAMFKSVFVFGQ